MSQFQTSKKSRKIILCIGILSVLIIILCILSLVINFYGSSGDGFECDENNLLSNKFTGRIINGNTVVPHSYPWIVSIQKKKFLQ